MTNQEIKKIREKIDAVDEELIPLLETRFAWVAKLAPHKTSITDQKREQEITAKTNSLAVKKVYQQIFSVAKSLMNKNNL